MRLELYLCFHNSYYAAMSLKCKLSLIILLLDIMTAKKEVLRQAPRTLEGHTDIITSFSLISNGRVVSSSGDHTLKVWDIERGKEIASFHGDSGFDCCAVKRGNKGDSIANDSALARFVDNDELLI